MLHKITEYGLRMCPALLLFTLFLVSSASAHTPLHVEWREERLSVSAEKEPLAQILHEVARQTGMEIRGLEGLQEQVSVRFAGLPLQEGLQKLSVNYLVVWQTSPQRGWRPVLSLVSRRKVPSPPEALLREANPSPVGTQPEGEPGLGDTQEERLRALHALAKQSDEETVLAALGAALADEDATVKSSAIQALADRGGAEALEYLHQAFRDPDPAIRRLVLESVIQLDDGLPLVQEALADADETLRALARSRLELAGSETR